ncbi:hypothetical protein [Phormidesmis priestleyi]|uniref:hypothetical protein n=1 Tax=Phormidesmis priestleyi TaxID=268141 RepID=UPI0012E8B3EE|nr:hypothetical protein [Phormidesmis priestleyi]
MEPNSFQPEAKSAVMHSTNGLSAKVLHLPFTSPQTGQESDLLVGFGLLPVEIIVHLLQQSEAGDQPTGR